MFCEWASYFFCCTVRIPQANDIVSLILPKCYVEIAWTFVNTLVVRKE